MTKKHIYLALLITILPLLFGSCKIKSYTRSDVPVDSLYRGSQSADTTSIASIPWNDFFKDPCLIALIDEGLDNSFDLQAAIQRISEAQAYYKQSRLAFFPDLNFRANAGLNRLSENTASGAPLQGNGVQNYEIGLGASWEIDIWGKLRHAKKAQYATLLQTEMAKNAVQTQLIADIATAYYDLVSLDKKMESINQTIEIRKKSVETIKALKVSSQTTELAVNQAEAQLYNALGYLPQLEQSIRITENYLSMIIGHAPRAILRQSDTFTQVNDSLLNTGVPAQLLENRPDVKAAEYALISAHENLNVARTQFFPSLTISGAGGFNSSVFENWFNLPGSIFANVLGGLTQPLFNKGKLTAQKKVMMARREQSVINFKKTVINGEREVSDALVTFRKTTERIAIQNNELDALNKSVASSLELLKYGYANYLEVLQAQERLLSTEQSIIDTYKQRAQSKINLYRSLGGGWE